MTRVGKWNVLCLLKLAGIAVLGLILLVDEAGADSASVVTTDNNTTPGTVKPAFLVGFAQDTLANDWRAQQVLEVEQALAPYPSIKFIVKDGKGQTAKQILDIEDLIAQGVDVLITSPRDAKALTPVISRAYRQGIPVVLLDRHVEGEDFSIFIAPDNRAIARKAARYLGEKYPAGGSILMLTGLCNATTTIDRTQAFVEELVNFKQLEIVAEKTASYLRGDAIQAVEEVLASDIQFDIIYAQSDSMASGARMALKRAGIDPHKISIIGIDYISEAQAAIRAGEQDASFTYPTGGKEGAHYVLRILNGEEVPKKVVIESEMVTIENAKQLEPIF
ncbi:MAG: substrate-binding domain-containing protein [Gammaproteobacteria bacterium]